MYTNQPTIIYQIQLKTVINIQKILKFEYLTGASYTPEYYINIRTGTHYFPKSVGTIGVEPSNRVKYGLNKIEETRNESGGNDTVR